jgi:ABC-type proline/glycine betaine transport system ATPase subunit
MSLEAPKNEFVPQFLAVGEHAFYRYQLVKALTQMMNMERGSYKGISPELGLLNSYEQFLILYRREGEKVYLDMARVFRRVSHKIYRMMLKKGMTQRNAKFLNLV